MEAVSDPLGGVSCEGRVKPLSYRGWISKLLLPWEGWSCMAEAMLLLIAAGLVWLVRDAVVNGVPGAVRGGSVPKTPPSASSKG